MTEIQNSAQVTAHWQLRVSNQLKLYRLQYTAINFKPSHHKLHGGFGKTVYGGSHVGCGTGTFASAQTYTVRQEWGRASKTFSNG